MITGATMAVLFKAFVFFWPFLKSVLFNDRPVKQVLYAHRHLTIVFLLFVVVSYMLVVMTLAYSEVKRKWVPPGTEKPPEVCEPAGESTAPAYDKTRVIELLDGGSE